MAFTTWFIDWIRRLIPSFVNRLAHVSNYTRELPINLDRMYENAIDWEHLPWLHSSTFADIEVVESGNWGWKAKAWMHPKSSFTSMVLELRLDRNKNRWITKTLSGLGKGTEIWTHAIPLDENKIKVVVDFYVPKLPSFLKKEFGMRYNALYAKLYDEDLWMMEGRQKELNKLDHHQKERPIPFSLGKFSELKSKLPYNFEYNHRAFRLISLEGELVAHSTVCPHMLGPLNDADIENGILECPWHGYRFDLKTRKCISGQRCRMAPAPKIEINEETGEVIAHF